MAAFSPDGKQIAFGSSRGGGGIFVMGATGESVKRVADMGFNYTWSPDGKFLAYSTKPVMYYSTTPEDGKILTVNIETGEKTAISGEYDAVQPHWSPHGQRIVYWSFGDAFSDIWTLPATGGKAVPVTDDEHIDWNPVWSPNGDFVYFVSDRGGTMSLWRTPIVEETGEVLGEPELVTTSVAAEIRHISISADGRRLVYSARLETSNLQRVAFDPSTERVVGEPVQITRGSVLTTWPDPSPDGEWVAFNIGSIDSARQGLDIAIVRSDGTDLRRLTSDAYRHRMPRWSPPDGSRIAFYSNRSGDLNLWSISSEGGDLRQHTDIQGGRVNHLAWSPDGLRIVVNDGTSGSNYIFAVDKGWEEQTPEELPPFFEGPFTANSWSPDGRFLVGWVGDSMNNYLTLYSLETQEYERLQVIGSYPVWLNDSRRLLYLDYGSHKLCLLDVESGNQQAIFPSDRMRSLFGVSRDDREIHFVERNSQADIWMLTLAQEE